MKFVSSLAIAASLIASGALVAPAAAQSAAAEAPKPQRVIKLSKGAEKAIQELQAAVGTPDYSTKLAAAQAVAKSTEDRYYIAKLQLKQAGEDATAQRAAVEAILASGGADATETTALRNYLQARDVNAGDFGAAEQLYGQRIAANPNDVSSLVSLAAAKIGLKKQGEALELLQRAIVASKAAGKTPEEAWYRNALQIAYAQNNTPVAVQLGQEVLTAYPSQENFRNFLAVSTPTIAKDQQTYVDLLRLMVVSGTMESGQDYVRLANQLELDRFPGEAKSVIEAAQRAGKITGADGSAVLARVNPRVAEDRAALPIVEPKARAAADGRLALSTATAYAGYGNYAKAAELYRLALQKGGVDANLVNTRLGIALALGGQRAEAETAFRAVTGPRASLATLWLSWLAQRS